MLTPEFLLRIAEAAEEKTAELNNYIVGRISKRIINLFTKEGDVKLIPASILDVKKARETGKLAEEVSKEVQKKLPEIQKEVKTAFERAANQIEGDMGEFTKHVVEVEIENGNLLDVELPELSDYEKSGIPKKIKDLHLTPKEVRLLERAYRKTNGTLRNLTGTTADSCQKTFINAVDRAYWKATHGVSPSAAISEAVEEVASTGTIITYPSGHTDRIEVAVARAVRTGVNQAAADVELVRCAEMGVSAVRVSSHFGARYTEKAEPANHMSWQGKVYSLDWNNEVLKRYCVTEEEKKENRKMFSFFEKIESFFKRHKEKTEGDFIEKTGYGTGEGLCGWNCRHHFGPYYKGISINHNKDYDSTESRKQYDLEQKQRAMERNIRKLHREREAYKAAMDESPEPELKKELKGKYEKAKDKLNQKRKEYTEFSDENNLKTRAERLKIPKIQKKEMNESGRKGKLHKGNNDSMFTGTPLEKAMTAQDLTGKYCSRKSKWSGKLITDDEMCSKEKISGRKNWNCDILIKSSALPKTYIHEQLHARSGSYMNQLSYIPYGQIEENTVELLSREICKAEGLSYVEYDSIGVNALRNINHIIKQADNDLDFAESLFAKDLPVRYTYLENRVKRFISYHPEKEKELNQLLRVLKGPKQ